MRRGAMYKVGHFGAVQLENIWSEIGADIAGEQESRIAMEKTLAERGRLVSDLSERYRPRQDDAAYIRAIVDEIQLKESQREGAIEAGNAALLTPIADGLIAYWETDAGKSSPTGAELEKATQALSELRQTNPKKAALEAKKIQTWLAQAEGFEAQKNIVLNSPNFSTITKIGALYKNLEEAKKGAAQDAFNKYVKGTPEDQKRLLDALEATSSTGLVGGADAFAWVAMNQEKVDLGRRYVEALQDSDSPGAATVEELGEDFAAAEAAYKEMKAKGAYRRNETEFFAPDYLKALSSYADTQKELNNPLFEGRTAAEERLRRYAAQSAYVPGQRGKLAPRPAYGNLTHEEEIAELAQRGVDPTLLDAFSQAQAINKGGSPGASIEYKRLVDQQLKANPKTTAQEIVDAVKKMGGSKEDATATVGYLMARTIPKETDVDPNTKKTFGRAARAMHSPLLESQNVTDVKRQERRQRIADRLGYVGVDTVVPREDTTWDPSERVGSREKVERGPKPSPTGGRRRLLDAFKEARERRRSGIPYGQVLDARAYSILEKDDEKTDLSEYPKLRSDFEFDREKGKQATNVPQLTPDEVETKNLMDAYKAGTLSAEKKARLKALLEAAEKRDKETTEKLGNTQKGGTAP